MTTGLIPNPKYSPLVVAALEKGVEKDSEGNSWLSVKEHHDRLVMSAMIPGSGDDGMSAL